MLKNTEFNTFKYMVDDIHQAYESFRQGQKRLFSAGMTFFLFNLILENILDWNGSSFSACNPLPIHKLVDAWYLKVIKVKQVILFYLRLAEYSFHSKWKSESRTMKDPNL